MNNSHTFHTESKSFLPIRTKIETQLSWGFMCVFHRRFRRTWNSVRGEQYSLSVQSRARLGVSSRNHENSRDSSFASVFTQVRRNLLKRGCARMRKYVQTTSKWHLHKDRAICRGKYPRCLAKVSLDHYLPPQTPHFFLFPRNERERETSFLSRMQNGRGVDDVECRAPEDGSLRGSSLGPDTHRVPHGTRAQVLTFVSVRLGMRPICGLSHDWATERRSAAGFVVAPTFSRCSSRSSRTS